MTVSPWPRLEVCIDFAVGNVVAAKAERGIMSLRTSDVRPKKGLAPLVANEYLLASIFYKRTKVYNTTANNTVERCKSYNLAQSKYAGLQNPYLY